MAARVRRDRPGEPHPHRQRRKAEGQAHLPWPGPLPPAAQLREPADPRRPALARADLRMARPQHSDAASQLRARHRRCRRPITAAQRARDQDSSRNAATARAKQLDRAGWSTSSHALAVRVARRPSHRGDRARGRLLGRCARCRRQRRSVSRARWTREAGFPAYRGRCSSGCASRTSRGSVRAR